MPYVMAEGFSWDDGKAAANFRKHGVDFESSTDAFGDPFRIDEIDESMHYGETRFILTGQARGKLLVVIYTERGDLIRIISARRATRQEHDRYYRANS
jgi:uncharacterized DUF497 family protein